MPEIGGGPKNSFDQSPHLLTPDCADPEDVALAATSNAVAASGSSGGLELRAVWQMSSMCLGIGIFAIPYVFMRIGVVHGACWIVVMGVFANVALQCLLDLAADCNLSSYEALAYRAFGPAGKLAMTIITMVTTGIATLSYLGAARTLLVGVAVAFFVDFDVNSEPGGVTVLSKAKDCTLLLVLCAAVLPRLFSRTMGANAWISSGGVCAMTLASVFFVCDCLRVLTHGCDEKELCGSRPQAFEGNLVDALQYVAVLAFSFSMVFALFPMLEESAANGATVAAAAERMKPVVRASVVLSCCIYLLVGLCGSLAFGTDTQSLALQNLTLAQPLTQIISFVVGVSATLLVAIIAFPTVTSLERLAGMCRRGGPAPGGLRPGIVVGVGAACVLVDAFLPTKVAFALTGSLGLAMGAYIMPCLLFLKLAPSGRQTQKALAVVILLFGCVLLFGSTPVTVLRLLQGDSGPAPKALSDLLCHQPTDVAWKWPQVVV